MLGLRKNAKLMQGKTQGCRLLTAEVMDRNLSRERERCDRYCQYFSLIIVRVADNAMDKFVANLDSFLEERLRLSDDVGYLKKGGIGILLPMTDFDGAKIVESGVHSFAKDNNVVVTTELFTYAGRGSAGEEKPGQSLNATAGDTSRGEANEDGLNAPAQFSSNSMDCSATVGNASFQSRALPKEVLIGGGDNGNTAVCQIEATESDPFELFPQYAPQVERRSVKDGVVEGYREVELLEYCATPFPFWKRALDVIAASAGLVLTSPILLGAAIAIKLTSRGPVFFKQMRSGQYGRPFPVYKLRTMVVDAEELKAALQERNERDGPAFKLKDDPRVTSVGHFLRRVGADELPQLVNVLMGHMSIVGPRPLPIAEDEQCASWQRKRLDTKPGLTCTWQIGKSRGISFMEWMRLDRKYGKDRSIVTDIKLVFKTIGAVIMGRVGH